MNVSEYSIKFADETGNRNEHLTSTDLHTIPENNLSV